MTIGKNRSPNQIFGRATFEPDPGDPDLLPKPVVLRPAFNDTVAGRRPQVTEEVFDAPDLEGLPWVRTVGNRWTTAPFRARIIAFVRQFFRARSDQGLTGWRIVESAERRGPLTADRQNLTFCVRKRIVRGCDPQEAEAEVGIAFPDEAREGAALEPLLVALESSLDAALSTIV